jgi:hypothetical protein
MTRERAPERVFGLARKHRTAQQRHGTQTAAVVAAWISRDHVAKARNYRLETPEPSDHCNWYSARFDWMSMRRATFPGKPGN